MAQGRQEDIRVAHAAPGALSRADLVRRAEIVALLRTPAHELDEHQRRHARAIRASFDDAGDYVDLLGARYEHAWVVGSLRRVDGRLCLFRLGQHADVFEVALEADPGSSTDDQVWFGRTSTDRSGYPCGPVDLLEQLKDGDT